MNSRRHAQPVPRPELLLKFKPESRTTVSRETVRRLAEEAGCSETQLIHRALAQYRDRAQRVRRPAKAKAKAAHGDGGMRPAVAGARPQSLREATTSGEAHGAAGARLREFLDHFYVTLDASARSRMLADEPPLSADARANAYVAAVAEHLALRHQLPVPSWTAGAERFLRRPHFPAGLENLKATLIQQSPAAFRRRLIFVEADPLYRPRRDTGASPLGGRS